MPSSKLPFASLCSALVCVACTLVACSASMQSSKQMPTPASTPLVIGHRGLPGRFPEETRPAYEAAADAGADALEEDLHLSRDCVLVARHNPWLSDNTNVATVAAAVPAVAARRRTVPGRWVDVRYDAATVGGPSRYLVDLTDPADPKSVLKSLVVDGEDHTNDWSISDFTVAELKRWIRGTTYDNAAQRPTAFNGRDPVMTFQDIIDLAREKGRAAGRTIAVYPEVKNPIWNDAQAIANGCGAPGSHPFEDAVLKSIRDNGLNRPDAPIFVQGFDPASLKYLRAAGLRTKLVQLIDGNGVDYRSGAVIYATRDARTFVNGRPYSWTVAGDPRDYAAMLTPAGLAEIRSYADGIGPWKPQLMSWRIEPARADATGTLADVNRVTPTGVIDAAHAAGLFVHAFTFRDEARYLPGVYGGDAQAELLQFFRAGLDGAFTDFADTGVAARRSYLRDAGR